MLRWRLLGAFAMIVPLLAIFWLDDQMNGGRPGIWIGPLALVVGLLAAQEVNQLIAQAGLATSATTNLAGVFCVLGSSLIPLAWTQYPANCPVGKLGWTLLGLAVAVGLVFAVEVYRYRAPGESIARLAGGSLALLYVGVTLSLLFQIRLVRPGRLGLMAVIATLLIVKLSDTGAYFVGKSIGRRHFTAVSPKKTLEGVAGGVAAAILAAGLVWGWLLPLFTPDAPRGYLLAYVAYGASLAVAGLLGDLSESLLKRDVQQKDSSRWLRGLGGVLDILDSVLAAAPVSFLWWASGWL
jgi:phosphatidate cytidylyltransferase